MVAAALRANDSGRDVVLSREDRASTTLFKVFDLREPGHAVLHDQYGCFTLLTINGCSLVTRLESTEAKLGLIIIGGRATPTTRDTPNFIWN